MWKDLFQSESLCGRPRLICSLTLVIVGGDVGDRTGWPCQQRSEKHVTGGKKKTNGACYGDQME